MSQFQRKKLTSRKRVTDRSVANACERLGEDVTLRNVRELLGGGSTRDIGPKVKAWKASAMGKAAAASDLAKMLVNLDAWGKAFLSQMDHRLNELKRLENSIGFGESRDELVAIRAELSRQLLHYRTEGGMQHQSLVRLDAVLAKLEGLTQRLEQGLVRN